MRALRKLNPGQKGTRKYLARYGEQLFCVRYRYDRQKKRRYTTVELIVDEADWVPPIPGRTIVGVEVGMGERELQQQVCNAGGVWNRARGLWEMRYDKALKLKLEKRIVLPRASDSKHPEISNTGHPKVSDKRH